MRKTYLITIFDVTLHYYSFNPLAPHRLILLHILALHLPNAHAHPVLSLLPNPHKPHWPGQDEMKTRLIATVIMNLATTDTPLSTPRSCRIPSQAPTISPQDEDRGSRLGLCDSSTGLRQLLWTPR